MNTVQHSIIHRAVNLTIANPLLPMYLHLRRYYSNRSDIISPVCPPSTCDAAAVASTHTTQMSHYTQIRLSTLASHTHDDTTGMGEYSQRHQRLSADTETTSPMSPLVPLLTQTRIFTRDYPTGCTTSERLQPWSWSASFERAWPRKTETGSEPFSILCVESLLTLCTTPTPETEVS